MQSLIFDAPDVRRVVEHSIASEEQQSKMVRDERTGELVKEEVNVPSVLLARDHGVYLMSNGLPRDIVSDARSFAAYAWGCDPFRDPDWRDKARMLAGDDDFSIALPWAHDLKALIDAGARTVVLNFKDGCVEIAEG
ncbi:hypothetical protein A5906_26530 [Bradyrhizobium sacchari]|uniref:DUF3085 family protein n=1 Tax=Bradyrhizobium sacchari TaxID=1399419 RepID=A0A560K6C3_9BRAD|nr:DUF3085 domain-containing protein [Bradyrhizobium sacchari]OPY99279.1 hypothetical protein A5906_26530 [Bradyrhizobium sacchari]TWB62900.1 DUF3085 family protein [Bradyrhizobium sacchari]TWB76170.1 DUF3085 family protein [Bradyrhizobium sacchari]